MVDTVVAAAMAVDHVRDVFSDIHRPLLIVFQLLRTSLELQLRLEVVGEEATEAVATAARPVSK